MFSYLLIHTSAKVLQIFKEAKFLGNWCENCDNQPYQHTTQVFYCISAKVLLLRFIAHWEIDDDPWQLGTYQKVSLPVACGRHLELDTTWLFFHIYCTYATQAGVGQSDVSRILSKHHQTGSAKDRPRQGRPKKTNAWEDRVLAQMTIQNRTKSSSQLAREWGHRLHTQLSRFTVSRWLSATRICSRQPRKQAPLTVRHKREHVQWAQQYSQRNVWFWHRIMWHDESWFCLYHVDGRNRVWQWCGEGYNQDCVQPRPQAFGGSVMVWGMMSYEHKNPLTKVHGNLNGTSYRDEILDITVRPHFQQFQVEQPIFLDDNAHPHWACLEDTYKVQHNIDSLQWPSMSPDLNLIEHVWDAHQKAVNAHQKAVNARQPPVTTLQELDMALHQEWNQMPQQTCRNLVQSMRRQSYRLPGDIPTTDAPVTLQWTF